MNPNLTEEVAQLKSDIAEAKENIEQMLILARLAEDEEIAEAAKQVARRPWKKGDPVFRVNDLSVREISLVDQPAVTGATFLVVQEVEY